MLEGRQRQRLHLRVALQVDRGSLLAALARSAGPHFEHRQGRIDERMRALEHVVEPSRVGARQVGVGEQRVASVPPRVVVGQHRLTVPFGAPERDDAGAHRRDVLEAIEAREEQVAGVEDLEMRGAGHIVLPAHPDHRHRARERQPEVDLQRRGAIGDVAFGGAPRFLRIARDGGIERIRGRFTIDMRPGQRHARRRADARCARSPSASRTDRSTARGRGTT